MGAATKYIAEPTAVRFHHSPAFFRGLMGPIGSGKSVACVNELLRLAFNQAPNKDGVRKSRFAAIRNTYPELKSTTIKTWQDWMPDDICPINWGSPITGKCQLELGDGTTVEFEILFLALDLEKDVKKLLSLELTAIWFNEAREMRKSLIDAGTGRVGRYPAKRDGGPTRACCIADTNPPDDDHWWYELSEESPPKGWEFFRQPPGLLYRGGEWVGNPKAENISNLPGGYQYYQNQVGGKTMEWIKVYVLGQYGTVQDGKPVYPGYNDAIHCAKEELQANPNLPLLLGWDFGGTPACIVIQITAKGRVMVLAEFISEGLRLRQFVKQVVNPGLKRLFPKHGIGLSVGDPSGRNSVDTDAESCMGVLRQEKIPTIPAVSNAPAKRIGAVTDALSTLVDGKPGLQLSPRCRMLRKGFNGGYKYVRVQVTGDERYRDKPDKNRFSHPHDALQYIVMEAVGRYVGSIEDDDRTRSDSYQMADDVGY